ncbi:cardiolipin synthase [Stackebrandtia albiflava]|uniref:Cardiolipin synthase n=1 Tax=Stackebrandtia albiflava TaxID=406432 RepID=A0A562VD93_9ACTN|nr:CDP-alcohol phosphatidyltransferase family protein [Stackebrandtia albiflava]TWJ15849.1 cardiolipin synthase [Stackebrandtia albiflava]
MSEVRDSVVPWRVWTWPNLITLVRLCGIPVFCHLLLVAEDYVAAVVVLAVGGGTDWVDGFLARRLGQESRFGQLLDPAVDRLYILVTVAVMTLTGLLPWQFTAVLVARELVMAATLLFLRYQGFDSFQVHYTGKTATFIVFMSFPVLVLAGLYEPAVDWARPLGWALAWWGIVLYWLSAAIYVGQAVWLARRSRDDVPVAS